MRFMFDCSTGFIKLGLCLTAQLVDFHLCMLSSPFPRMQIMYLPQQQVKEAKHTSRVKERQSCLLSIRCFCALFSRFSTVN